MVAYNGQRVPAASYTLVGEDCPSITIQNIGASAVEVFATATNVAPAATSRGFVIEPGDALTNVLLSDLFPGVATPRYLWGRAVAVAQGALVVSHA